MARLKSIAKKLVLLGMGLVVGLIAVEVCLRVMGVSYPLPYAPDRYCGTRLQPGFRGWWRKEGTALIEVNRYGFRHGRRSPEKPPATFRVAVLGDSFIEAFQVPDEETFCGELERELNDRATQRGRRVEVLNFGVSGYGTAQELLMLRHHVWDYQPDLVVLAFFAGNDLRNNTAELEPYKVRPFFRLEQNDLVLDNAFLRHPDYLKACSKKVQLKVALINRSRILQLLDEARRNRGRRYGKDRDTERLDRGPGVDELGLAEPRDAIWRTAWGITERLILEINSEVSRYQTRFVVVVISNDGQVNPDRAARKELCRRLGVEDLFYCERRLKALGDENGFPVVNLAEPMQRHADQHGVFLHGFENTKLGEGHWNAEGHGLAARITAEAICGERWFKSEIRSTKSETTPNSQ